MSEKTEIIGKLTIQNPTVNIRRGPTTSAGILEKASAGDVFDVVSVLPDPTKRTVETWAQIVLPKNLTQNAYVCYRLASGIFLGNYEEQPGGVAPKAGYNDGWNDALDAVAAKAIALKKK